MISLVLSVLRHIGSNESTFQKATDRPFSNPSQILPTGRIKWRSIADICGVVNAVEKVGSPAVVASIHLNCADFDLSTIHRCPRNSLHEVGTGFADRSHQLADSKEVYADP